PGQPQHAGHDLHHDLVRDAGAGEGIDDGVRRRHRGGQRPADQRHQPDGHADDEDDETYQRAEAAHHVADRSPSRCAHRHPPPNGAAVRVAVTVFDPMPKAPSTTVEAVTVTVTDTCCGLAATEPLAPAWARNACTTAVARAGSMAARPSASSV